MKEDRQDWEIKIDDSREKHKHKPTVGGFKDSWNRGVSYCVPCDLFYYPQAE